VFQSPKRGESVIYQFISRTLVQCPLRGPLNLKRKKEASGSAESCKPWEVDRRTGRRSSHKSPISVAPRKTVGSRKHISERKQRGREARLEVGSEERFGFIATKGKSHRVLETPLVEMQEQSAETAIILSSPQGKGNRKNAHSKSWATRPHPRREETIIGK